MSLQLRITLVWDVLSNPSPVPGWPQCRTVGSLPTASTDSSTGFDLCTEADVIGEGTWVTSRVACISVGLRPWGKLL
jgi:hypothetical protein